MKTERYKQVILLLVPFALLVPAAAQDTQRFEVFGGYSLLHDDLMLPASSDTFNGWDAAFTVYLNNWLGVTTDVAGHYGSETLILPPPPYGTAGKVRFSDSGYTFLAGPHFVHHWSRYAPFAQALFGATYEVTNATTLVPVTCNPPPGMNCVVGTIGGSTSAGFTMALGGGVDIDVGHGISLRPVQAEYVLRRFSRVLPNNGSLYTQTYNVNDFRYSTGIVFHFGPHVGKNH